MNLMLFQQTFIFQNLFYNLVAMSFCKSLLVKILLLTMFFFLFPRNSTAKPVNSLIGVRSGDWARYIGSFPEEEYEWMLVSVLSVNGTQVKISLSYDLRPLHRSISSQPRARSQTVDIATGRGNTFLFFVPVNLSVGDSIPKPSYFPQLNIDGFDLREYAGVERKAMYTLSMPWNGEGIIYWDAETGLLLEILVKVGNAYLSSLRLFETNVWSVNLVDKLTRHAEVITLTTIIVSLSMIVFMMFRRQTKRVEHSVIKTEETAPALRWKAKSWYYSIEPYAGKVLMGMGSVLFLIGIMSLTIISQVIFSLSVIFGIVFFAVGYLIHTEAWAGTRHKIKIGSIMLSLSVIIFGIAVVCGFYREIGAMVPYKTVGGIGPLAKAVMERAIFTIETVFIYPYAWLVSPLVTLALCLAIYGIILGIRYEY